MSNTKMMYIIRHVRFLQQCREREEATMEQIDTRLHPADALNKWLDSSVRMRHYYFLMGYPDKARELWLNSSEYKNYKPKRIVPQPTATA